VLDSFYKFLDSNLLQNLILFLTAGITLWIFIRSQRKQVQNAAVIITLLIKDIEQNVEIIFVQGITEGAVQEKCLHYSKIIYTEDMWSKYSSMIVGQISQRSYEVIDNFFKVVSLIKEQQLLIKCKIQQSLDVRGFAYYNVCQYFTNFGIEE
jgi:cbb3-type cytochrome oxidase subunit 3